MYRVLSTFLTPKGILLLSLGAGFVYFWNTIITAIMDFSFGGIIPGTQIVLSPEIMLLAVAGTSGLVLMWQVISLIDRMLRAVQRRKRRRMEVAARQTYNYQIIAAQPRVYRIHIPLRMKFRIFWMRRLERFDDAVCLMADRLGMFSWRFRTFIHVFIGLCIAIMLWPLRILWGAAVHGKKVIIRSWIQSQPYLRRFDAWLEIRITQFMAWALKKISRRIEHSETLSVIVDAIGGSIIRKSKFRPMAAKVYIDKR